MNERVGKVREEAAKRDIVCVVGLGYVGLPLANAFSKHLQVIGFDIDRLRIDELGHANHNPNLIFTASPKNIKKGDFVIICVPTPVTKSKEPDLSYVRSAAEVVGNNLKRGAVVILESTVFPGVTEEIVRPIIEEISGWVAGDEFKVAYSPERINPGDLEHDVERMVKVVAGMDEATTELVAKLYSNVTTGVFRARDIKTAEAAKVIENIQRDLNIALMNELALIFDRMGLNTSDVLEAAATKWNFHRYSPGLVGGHCIPVDPYYLVYKAKELGYHPQVIPAGRAINDYMPKHVAELTIKALNNVGKVIKGSKVLIMGLTYKENVADTRETPVKGIIRELNSYGVEVYGYDPLLGTSAGWDGIELLLNIEEAPTIDCIIVSVAHDAFQAISLDELKNIMNDNPILIDVRGCFDPVETAERGFHHQVL